MSGASDFPPIEALIPHRGTMLLLDRVTDFADETASAEYTPLREAWYADPAGDMPAWIGIELMAQTVAALVALVKRRAGLPVKMGVLLGSRRYQATTASFAAGRALRIRAEMCLRDASGMAAYECAIEADGEALASATLKVYEPADFEQFVQGNP
jgi:predicted hotdog family 3-hydroxylacyl-ACP dehydratase